MIFSINTSNNSIVLKLIDDLTGKSLSIEELNPEKYSIADTIVDIVDDYISKNSSYVALQGIYYQSGEGSFTGIRIAATIANVIANQFNIPVVTSDNIMTNDEIVELLETNKDQRNSIPIYSKAPNITKPKK